MTSRENIICSDCDNFTYKDRRVEGKATLDRYGFCDHYNVKTSANTFYGMCPGAVRIPMEVKKPQLVKKLAQKRITKSSRK
tara:strand:+ start:1065 stop:1307 length:243 start_codon:yes stop_codon:yes gene_type:complete